MSNTVSPGTNNLSLKCNGCGASLYFAPGTRNLKCDHCGESNSIEADQKDTSVKSADYDHFIDHVNQNKKSDDVNVVNCSNCGSQTTLGHFAISGKCSFCTAPLVLSIQDGQQYLSPHYIIPFKINKQQAIDSFQNWLKGLQWVPKGLANKIGNNALTLQGIYLPCWTYDTKTITNYNGKRGEYYYTTERYNVTVNGNKETRTREVRHTKWTSVSGSVKCNFNNLMVPASDSLQDQMFDELGYWDLGLLVKFDERYLSGFQSETYQIGPDQGWLTATALAKYRILSEVNNDIGGDEQQISYTKIDHLDKAIKYIMVPVWKGEYSYNNKIYHFNINASTGKVYGKFPESKRKIVVSLLIILFFIVFWKLCSLIVYS